MMQSRSLKSRLIALAGMAVIVGVAVAGLMAAGLLGRPNDVQSAELLRPAAGQEFGTSIGDIAPDFTVSDLDGNRHRMSDYRGKPVLLNFWASWCLPCAFEMPQLAQFQAAHRDEIAVLVVNRGEPVDRARSYLRNVQLPDGSEGATFALHASDPDDTLYRAYRALGMPASYFIDSSGRIAHTANGPIPLDQMEQALASTP